MPEPVSEQIMQAVKARMLTVTTDTQRGRRVAVWHPKHSTLVITQGAIDRNDELSCPGNPPAQAWDMEAIVACVLKPSDADTTPIDTYRNRFSADVIQAANTGDSWHTWGGLAINSVVNSVEEHIDDDGAFAGVRVPITITFRTDENNPYNWRA